MKKGQVYEAAVTRIDFPNKGMADTGEGIVTVKNSLPGQKIRLSVNKVRNGKAEGRLLEVLEKSPLETGNPCSRFGVCGGCLYLSLPYEEQLRIKEAQVKKLLEGALARQTLPWVWEGIKGSPVAYEYRNKMEFSFGDEVKDGPLSLGMHRRDSHYDVVNVEDCRIVDGDYRLILKTVREYFAGKGVRYYHRMRHEGYLRHLLVRKASRTGELLVALVTTSQEPFVRAGREAAAGAVPEECCEASVEVLPEDCREAAVGASVGMLPEGCCEAAAEAVPEELRKATEGEPQLLEGFLEALLSLEREGKLEGSFAGILHIVNDSQADVVQSDRSDVLYGREYFYEELLGLRFKISVFSFFQTNTHSAEVLYETVRRYVGNPGREDAVVYDLYSGTGTIAQLMAAVAGKVIGVEIVEEAVEAARENAAENSLRNCEFLAGDVLKVLDDISQKPDLIILDPPRDGVHPKALPKIIGYGVERIVYISCKPTSLARDLEAFLAGGYAVEKAVAVDQFPWTANVETVVQLSLKRDTPRIEVTMEPDAESNYTPADKATYQKIKAYVQEKHGLKVSSLYVAQIKDKCGLNKQRTDDPSGNKHHVPKCPPEKEAAIMDAFRHFNMI